MDILFNRTEIGNSYFQKRLDRVLKEMSKNLKRTTLREQISNAKLAFSISRFC